GVGAGATLSLSFAPMLSIVTRRALSLSLISLLACAPLTAQEKSGAPDKPAEAEKSDKADKPDKEDKEDKDKEATPDADAEPPPVVTAHSTTVGSQSLSYHVTAGYLVLKAEGDGGDKDDKDKEKDKFKDNLKPKAKVFFIAYTLDGASDPATRPLT